MAYISSVNCARMSHHVRPCTLSLLPCKIPGKKNYFPCFQLHPTKFESWQCRNVNIYRDNRGLIRTARTKAVPHKWQEGESESISHCPIKKSISNPQGISSFSLKLETPQIIFSNNHLLVVNKPPGWKSQPSQKIGQHEGPDPKCLLTHLQTMSLGGGSQKNFLIPTHRLDQPCTGVLIFAKNGKAASRVQVTWSKREVQKCYWVVVEGGSRKRKVDNKLNGLELLHKRSVPVEDRNVYRLSAVIESGESKNTRKTNKLGGSSVSVRPILPNLLNKEQNGRICHIEWKHLMDLSSTSTSTTRHLLSVKTDTGAKHQVRALLALAGGAPVVGDLRYGNNFSMAHEEGGIVHRPLSDGSVALHARSVFLPTVSLGGMEFLKEEPFIACIPPHWMDFFGICEDDVRHLDH